MAIKQYNHDLDLLGNRLIDPRAEELESEPDDRGPGHWYYDSSLACFRFNEAGTYRGIPTDTPTGHLQMSLNNNRRAIPLGRVNPPIRVPWPCTLTSVTLEGGPGETGGFEIDVWKAASETTIPTDANSIVGADPPTIVAARYSTDSNLTGWSPDLVAENRLWISVTANGGGFRSMLITFRLTRT